MKDEWEGLLEKVKNKYGINEDTKLIKKWDEVYVTDREIIDNYSNAQKEGNTCTLTAEYNGAIYKLVIENYTSGSPKKTLYKYVSYTNSALDLQPIVAKWYVTLRNIALVMSMSVLVYVGIRMMLTSIAAEKAKYKTMLFDWVIGIGLMFIMQYVMVFATALNDEFIDLVASGTNELKGNVAAFPINDKWNLEQLNETGQAYKVIDGIVYYPTNLMGGLRIAIQDGRNDTLTYAGMTIAFLVMVFYTAFFIFTYIKRVIYMAFLTIIAPFVALTYPLDKISDGKAQAFNMWIKEYIFNLLIQPMHLLLYYILISSAIKLATENVLYTLVALGFLIPAEKLIRKFFGFDKAQTPGFLGGAAGAGIVMSAVGNLRRFASPSKGGKDGSEKDTTGKNRTKDSKASLDVKDMFNDGKSSSLEESSQGIRTNSNAQNELETREEATRMVDTSTEEATQASTQIFDESTVTTPTETMAPTPSKSATKGDGGAPSETKQKDEKKSGGSDDAERSFGAKIRGATGSVLGSAGRGIMRVASKTPGLIARGYGAATLGAIGLAAGIATGDANNAFQYTLTGAGAGSAVGAGLFNRATKTAGNIQDDWIRGWYGDKYDEYLNKKSDRQFMLSKENRNYYKSMFGDDWYKRMEEALKYRQYKVTDNKIIAKAMLKLNGYSEKERIQLAQWASKVDSKEDWARMRDSLKNKYNWSDARLNKVEDGIYKIKF